MFRFEFFDLLYNNSPILLLLSAEIADWHHLTLETIKMGFCVLKAALTKSLHARFAHRFDDLSMQFTIRYNSIFSEW